MNLVLLKGDRLTALESKASAQPVQDGQWENKLPGIMLLMFNHPDQVAPPLGRFSLHTWAVLGPHSDSHSVSAETCMSVH